MKLAISISGNKLDSPFDPRFGRAAAFCLVESDTGAWTAHENPALSASGGAGVRHSVGATCRIRVKLLSARLMS